VPLALQEALVYVVVPFHVEGEHAPNAIGEVEFEMIAPLQPGEEKRDTM
jgi:hypothetical protein